MRIYFVGIGGSGVGPLALMAHQAGYEVVGSDAKNSSYIRYLQSKGIEVSLDQSGNNIEQEHKRMPIDWVVGVSSIIRDKADHPELEFARNNNIQIYERDALLNKIIKENGLKLIAVAGTHGKTTTTAMIIWLMKSLNIPISYSVGAKLSFAEMSEYVKESKYFVYECDEFHKNFLHFYPDTAAITGIAWDHHEVFNTEAEYNNSFLEFLKQSSSVVIFEEDSNKIGWPRQQNTKILNKKDAENMQIKIHGEHFRQDAWVAINAVKNYCDESTENLIEIINRYPGSGRRMEKLTENLYTDYAHTPEKIMGCLATASEMLKDGQKLVVVYEPLTNRRQHYIKHHYKDLFYGVNKLYWVPSYLAREDSSQVVLEPSELIKEMDNSDVAEPAILDDALWDKIAKHLSVGDFVVLISGGGGDSLDEWARNKLNT